MPSGHNWQAAALASLQSKLEQFHQSLTDEERPVMDALLAQAGAHSVAEPKGQKAVGQPESIIFVGGHTIPVWVSPGTWISLNPQPIPPGRSGIGR